MKTGLEARLDRLFNRHGDGRAVCVAADHGYVSDVTENVVRLRPITEAVIKGGVDGILMSPGQAMRLAPLFQGRDGPALIERGLDEYAPAGQLKCDQCGATAAALSPKGADGPAGAGIGRNRHHDLSLCWLRRLV